MSMSKILNISIHAYQCKSLGQSLALETGPSAAPSVEVTLQQCME